MDAEDLVEWHDIYGATMWTVVFPGMGESGYFMFKEEAVQCAQEWLDAKTPSAPARK